jgi:hypothetical protein
MERRGRLTAALAALTVPWLAPQMGCSLLSDEPSTRSLTSPAERPSPQGAGTAPPPSSPLAATPRLVATDGVVTAAAQVKPAQPPAKKESAQAADGSTPQPAAPTLEATDRPLPINLATALRLADARPLLVAAAQAQTWVAEGQFQRAAVLWLPQLNLGGDYERHDGYGPDFNRGLNTPERPLNQNINFMYTGVGLTYAPGIQSTDIIFEPLATRQVLRAQRWNIQTGKNDALLQTARAYFDVHQARGTYAGALDTVSRGRKLVAQVEELAKDLVPAAELDRARRTLADLEQQASVARVDPRAVVDPLESDQLQITLIDPAQPLDELIPVGLTNRPELSSQQAIVRSLVERIRQEKLRPLMPTFLLTGFQTPGEYIEAGATGIGSGNKLNLWDFRDDFSPQLLWQAEGMGLGNMARVKIQRGQQSLAIVELYRIQDSIASDVTRAQARLQSAALRAVQTERELREAIVTFEKNYEGLRQTTRLGGVLVQAYRPQEVVEALLQLKSAYDNYYRTVADYNRAQFELFHALGYPAQDLSTADTSGRPMLIDTSRPGYLPPVGTGPPPATK